MENHKVSLLDQTAIDAARAYGSDWMNQPYRCPKCSVVMTFSMNHLRHCNGVRGEYLRDLAHKGQC